MSQQVKKVSITGPESTGKSWLAKKLAEHYQTAFAPEFARKYIERLGREYQQEDILLIAQNQLEQEKQLLGKARNYLFCDTDVLVTRIWSLHRYGNCDPWIEEQFVSHRYDLYLLCDIDLPWEYDPQREHPHLRDFFFQWYKKELTAAALPFAIVSGTGTQRLQSALRAIEKQLKNG